MLPSINRKQQSSKSVYDKGKPLVKESLEKAIKNQVEVINAGQLSGAIPAPQPTYKSYENVNPYHNRIIDTLARLFSFSQKQTICTAISIVEEEGNVKCYVSYNCPTSTSPELENSVRSLFKIISEVDGDISKYGEVVKYHLNYHNHTDAKRTFKKTFYFPTNYEIEIFHLVTYIGQVGKMRQDLLINGDLEERFVKFFELIKEVVQLTNLSELQSLINKLEPSNPNSDYNNLKKALNDDISEPSLLQKLNNLLDTAQSRMSFFMKRLDQDSYKIVKCFKDSCLKDLKVEDIVFLPNPNHIHSELNLREFLKSKGLYPCYMGNSKLSCFVCETMLRQDEEESPEDIIFSGGHGIAYSIIKDGLPPSLIDGTDTRLLTGLLSINVSAESITEQGVFPDAALQYAPLSPREEVLTPVGYAISYIDDYQI